MNTTTLTRALTNTVVVLLFWGVFLLSLFLRMELTLINILFDLVKSLIVAGFGWFFLLILNDTLIKSMVRSAKLSQPDRYQGGLIFHVTEPNRQEKSWQKKFREENPELFSKN